MSRCPGDRLYDHGFGCRQPRRLEPMTVEPIVPVMGVSAFGIRPSEASRDDRSDGAYALLPADISSSTVQLGARGEIGENAWRLPDFSTLLALSTVRRINSPEEKDVGQTPGVRSSAMSCC
jgi:hypothetical protein